MYDELGNERHKAVCELRKVRTELDESVWTWIEDVAVAIGAQDKHIDEYERMLPIITCRLIHLLGGDDGTCPNANRTSPNAVQGASITDEPVSQESPNLANCDTENGGEITITDELRKWASDNTIKDMVLTTYPEQHGVHGILEQLIAIADRIDEQFNRICWQQEAVLQFTIDTMVDERDKLVDNRDMWRGKAMQLTDVVDRYVGRYEDLLDLLRDAVVDFKNANYSWNYALIVGENITIETERNRLAKERDELRKSLREIAERVGVPHDIDLNEYSDDLVAKATLGKIDSTHEYIGALEWQRDRQRKLLDEYDKTHMKLPVDANGESVHVGDIMEYAEGGKPKEVIAVSDTEAFLVDDGPRYSSLCVHHVPVDTAEEIVRDIHLGKVTDSQAVERIRALP